MIHSLLGIIILGIIASFFITDMFFKRLLYCAAAILFAVWAFGVLQ